MDRDEPTAIRHRIRWGNLARVAALLAAIGLVVLWPRLRSAPPELPAAGAVPVTAAPAAMEKAPAAPVAGPAAMGAKFQAPRRSARAERHGGPRRHAQRGAGHHRSGRRAPARLPTAPPLPAARPRPAAAWWTPPTPTAAQEFGPG